MVYKNKRISLVIPAYNEERLIIPTIMGVPDFVDHIIIVDDHSIDHTRELIKEYKDKRIILIELEKNQGVGNAIITGYKESIKLDVDIAAVCGADHQFDLEELPIILDPIVENKSDYVKGNRYLVDAKYVMPIKRYIGNTFLSILTRISSGNHKIFDTQDGYTAISKKVLKIVDWDLFWRSYGYVSDFIIKISAYGFKITDAPRRSIYIEGERQSQIEIKKYIRKNLPMIINGFFWRILNQNKLNKICKQKMKELGF